VDNLGKALHSFETLGRQAKRELATAAAAPASPEKHMGLALQPGAQVFDLVTGQKGEVVSGTRAHYVVQPAGR